MSVESIAMLIWGIVSLLGYVLTFGIIFHYLKVDGYGSPSSSNGIVTQLSDRSTEWLATRIASSTRFTAVKNDSGVVDSYQCPACNTLNDPDYKYCSNCATEYR